MFYTKVTEIFIFVVTLSITLGLTSVIKELETGGNIDVSSDKNYKLLPSLETCGISNEIVRVKRVIGGRPISSFQYPWMAQLYLLNVSMSNSTLTCGGTFITKSVILTAGHCLTRIISGTSFVAVAFGRADRRKIKLCPWNHPKATNCSKKYTRGVKKVVIHENYAEGNLQNDIGLVFLDQPVKFSSVVRPICLPYSEELLKGWDDAKLKVMGWGVVTKYDIPGPRNLPKVGNEGDMHVRERAYCDLFHTRQYGILKGDRFCAGGEAGKGSCSGDSGGPLSKRLPVPTLDGKERMFQFGIVSSGTVATCGYQGRPHIFSNILFYMPWILKELSKNFTSDSAESFSAESLFDSKEISQARHESSTQEKAKQYKNELSTGLDIDVVAHPNVIKLPTLDKCGSVYTPKPITKKKKTSTEEYEDDDGESEFDAEKSIRKKRLVGGWFAGIGWFPFMGQIYARDAHTAVSELRCGCVIISSKAILTSANCVTELPPPWALDSVRVGNYNRNKTEECIEKDCFATKHLAIEKIIVHEGYTKFTQANNVAIIKLIDELQFNQFVQPICLPTSEKVVEDLSDVSMISAGWGRVLKVNGDTGSGAQMDNGASNLPKYIETILKPRSNCDRVYARFMGNLDRSSLCGGGESGLGECNADQGGPLMKMLPIGKNGTKKHVQFGIISFNECGQQGMPTTYVNILYFMPWILDQL